jgi:hypothetical protein
MASMEDLIVDFPPSLYEEDNPQWPELDDLDEQL